MISNTGTVSFILYGIFIAVAIIGLFVAIYFIKKDNIPSEKLEKIIDLAKYTIVSVCIATVTLIVTDLFKEREQDVKELEYFDRYAQDIKKVDGITERYLLSRYLSIVAPNGELKRSWQEYYDTLKNEYREYLMLKREEKNLDTLKNPTEEQLIKQQEIKETLYQKEAPLVSSYGNNLIPRVYMHISHETQRQSATSLQATLLSENFLVPGIENVEKKRKTIPSKTEVRYCRDEELADALRIISIIKSKNPDWQINETPHKIPGNGRGTRPGHFEIWFSKSL